MLADRNERIAALCGVGYVDQSGRHPLNGLDRCGKPDADFLSLVRRWPRLEPYFAGGGHFPWPRNRG